MKDDIIIDIDTKKSNIKDSRTEEIFFKKTSKQDIVDKIACRYNLKKSDAKEIFEKIFSEIVRAASTPKNDFKIQIPGFGTFRMVIREGHIRRNPITGFDVITPKRKTIKFKPSKTLLDKIN